MPRSSAAQRPLAPLTQSPRYPSDLLADIQATLAALADIKMQYEIDQEQLQACTSLKAIKQQFATQLEERYVRDREPYDQRLAALHHQMLALMELQDICRTA
jgi:hypothetical protein